MELVTLPEMEKGSWKILRFTVDCMDWHSSLRGRAVPMGQTYTKVTRNGCLVMSDTPAEQRVILLPSGWRSCTASMDEGLIGKGVGAKKNV